MDNCKYNIAIIYLLISLLTPIFSISQNETNNWYFGDSAGLDFNNGQVALLNNSNMNTPAGCSSISNSQGELLFYTNGQNVWNRNHDIMINGSALNAEIENNQSTLIVPDTTDENIYYIFTTKTSDPNAGIYYSKVEFNQNNPLGLITQLNVRITYNSTERITAIHSPETNSIKVVGLGSSSSSSGPQINKFYIINVGENINTPVTSPVLVNTIIGERTFLSKSSIMKFSPNGEYIAIGDDGDGYSGVYIYTFDSINNNLSHFKVIMAGYLFMPIPVYGIEFSADSQIIYFSGNFNNNGYLHKYFIHSTDDLIGKILIDSSQDYSFGSLQLASNGKIYMANFTPNAPYISNLISVINNPEEPDNINYNPLGITLNPSNSTKGLPNFVSSYFRNRIITENKCVSDSFEFLLDAYDFIDSAFWEFGDGNTSSLINPLHQYTLAGKYIVKATITINNRQIELFKEIEAYQLPEIDNSLNFIQCDLDDDGISFFNLNEINNNIYNPWPEEENQFNFYLNLEDANNDINEISNSNYFQNTSNPQQIYAKIINPRGCSTISSFFIEVQNQNLDYLEPFISCESSDDIIDNGLGLFNLNLKTKELIQQLNFPESNNINYYINLEDALSNSNPITGMYASNNNTLWVKITNNNNGCDGIATLELIVNQPIILDIDNTYQMCELKPNHTLDGNISNDTWEWTNNLGEILSTERKFELSTPGDYRITVTKEENGVTCSLTNQFTVYTPNTPTFDDIEITDNNLFISINGESSYEFSIDNQVFYGSGTYHEFYNVEPGIIDIYARDIYDCEIPIQTEISFVYFPKFFTPNGDNINDSWKVYGVSESLYNKAEITIFDRYGKNLFSMNLNNQSKGWDGTLKSNILPNADYWFKAYLIDKENKTIEKIGHFSLLR